MFLLDVLVICINMCFGWLIIRYFVIVSCFCILLVGFNNMVWFFWVCESFIGIFVNLFGCMVIVFEILVKLLFMLIILI